MALAIGLARNRSVEHLSLRSCSIGDQGMAALCEVLDPSLEASQSAVASGQVVFDGSDGSQAAATKRSCALRFLDVSSNGATDTSGMALSKVTFAFIFCSLPQLQFWYSFKFFLSFRPWKAIMSFANA